MEGRGGPAGYRMEAGIQNLKNELMWWMEQQGGVGTGHEVSHVVALQGSTGREQDMYGMTVYGPYISGK